MTDTHDAALDSTTSWLIAALGLGILVLVWGIIFTFTVYSQALAETFGLSGLRVSSVFSVTTAAFYIAGGAVGVLVARVPLRPVVAAAGLLFAVAVGLLQVVSSYPGVALAFGLMGTTGGAVFVIVISLVPQWFDEHEGRAMGITLTGNGLGIFVLPPVWVRLLDRTDIRGAFLVVGGAIVVVVLLASLVYRRPPGVRAGESSPADARWVRSMLTDARFLAALAGFALLWTWYFALSADFVGILTANGIARGVAATAFSIIGAISVVSRVISGEFADRIGIRTTFTAGVVLAGLGMFLLLVTSTRPVMYVTLVVFGVGLGAVAALFSPILIGRFGPANATAIVGLVTISEASTAFLVPVGQNVLLAATGGYLVPLVVMGGLTLAGAGLFYWGTAPTGESTSTAPGDVEPAEP